MIRRWVWYRLFEYMLLLKQPLFNLVRSTPYYTPYVAPGLLASDYERITDADLIPETITVSALLLRLHKICAFQSTERNGTASNSEITRWIKNGAIEIDGTAVRDPKCALAADAEGWFCKSLVMFPKGKRRSTLLWR